MAFITGKDYKVYVFVENEDIDRSTETSSHPVENGINIIDTTKRKPITLSISGVLVEYVTTPSEYLTSSPYTISKKKRRTVKASEVLSDLINMQAKGELVSYIGRNICPNMLITSFSTGHPNEVTGGATFDMTLTECRFAQNAYVEPAGGQTNGGEQQVDKGDGEEVWYTVQKGDTIWWLIWRKKDGTRADYRDLKREGADANSWEQNRDWVMNKNPNAFSRPGNDRTMQIGRKLLLGYR